MDRIVSRKDTHIKSCKTNQINMTKEQTNYKCQCGHLHNEHGESHSINYTAGLCTKCECKNFCMPPVQQESAFSPEKHAEWMKTNGWKVEFTKFFYGEWDKKRDTMKDFISKTISQEKEKMIEEIKELRSKEIDMIALKQTGMHGQGKIDAFKEVLDLLETK